jgi:hypothetical protein
MNFKMMSQGFRPHEWGQTIGFNAQARFHENHAILSNQWFATRRGTFGALEIRQNDRWETIDFYGGLRDSARIV